MTRKILIKKSYLVFALAVIVVLTAWAAGAVYNYVKSENRMICENISNVFEDQYKVLRVIITKENGQGHHLVISQRMPFGREDIIVDQQGFLGDIFQIQSIVMNIEKLELARDCYITDKQVSVFLKIFSPLFKGKVLDISNIGEVPPVYRSKDASDIMQRHTWKKIWAYVLDPSNKETIGVYNIILNIQNIGSHAVQEYLIFLKQDGRMYIKYPYHSNISPARRK